MTAYDAVICGAGVGGLTLAHILGRQGRRVLIIDKQHKPHDLYKGELIQPRSLAILQTLGLLDPLFQRGALRVDRLTCRTARGTELLALDYRELPGPFNHGAVHYYNDINAVIAEELDSNVELQHGISAQGLLWDSGRVIGVLLLDKGRTFQVDAPLIVACDGRTSRLRAAAGIEVRMRRYQHQLLSFDIANAPALGREMSMHLTRDGVRVLFQMPGGRARLYAQIAIGAFRGIRRSSLSQWVDWLLDTVPALAPVGDSLRASLGDVQVTPTWRFDAPEWTRPGLALLGDAVQVVHPTGGQGMNAAIFDAWILGKYLAEAGSLTRSAIDTVLRRYQEERRPRMNDVSRLSHSLALLFTATSRSARVIRPYLVWRNRRNRRLQYRITHNVAGCSPYRPFTAWDWLCASGLLPDPRAQSVPAPKPE